MQEQRGETKGPMWDGGIKGCRAITCLRQELQDKGGFKTCGVSGELAAEAKAIKEEHRKKEKGIWHRQGHQEGDML